MLQYWLPGFFITILRHPSSNPSFMGIAQAFNLSSALTPIRMHPVRPFDDYSHRRRFDCSQPDADSPYTSLRALRKTKAGDHNGRPCLSSETGQAIPRKRTPGQPPGDVISRQWESIAGPSHQRIPPAAE